MLATSLEWILTRSDNWIPLSTLDINSSINHDNMNYIILKQIKHKQI